MSMAGYTKLFSTIVTSTIWREPKETKILWITMLALANKDGVVEGSLPGLAHMAGLTVDETESAIRTLLSPDTYSRTKEFEGRRVEVFEGGWRLLNHAKYRAMLSKEERREYMKQKQREYRASKQVSTDVSDTDTPSTHAEADTEAIKPSPPGSGALSIKAHKAAKVHARDILHDALASATGTKDLLQMTRSAQRTCGVALADIKRVTPDLKPDEIFRRAAAYKRAHPTWSLTPAALAKYWGDFAPAVPLASESPQDGPKGWRDTLRTLYPENTYDGPWSTLAESIRQQIKSA